MRIRTGRGRSILGTIDRSVKYDMWRSWFKNEDGLLLDRRI